MRASRLAATRPRADWFAWAAIERRETPCGCGEVTAHYRDGTTHTTECHELPCPKGDR